MQSPTQALVREGSFWLNQLHASVRAAAEEWMTQAARATSIVQKVMEYLLTLMGHFAGIEFVTEFVRQMNRHLRTIPVQHLQDKISISSHAKVGKKNQVKNVSVTRFTALLALRCSC